MEPILKLDHIQKYYGNEGNITKAIQDISFSVEAGEFLGIMGASGSGKTTLLNCISTIDTVSAGHIYLEGTDITEIKPKSLARFRRENLGFVFQDFNLLDTLTISENIALALAINKTPAKEVEPCLVRRLRDLSSQPFRNNKRTAACCLAYAVIFFYSRYRGRFPGNILSGRFQAHIETWSPGSECSEYQHPLSLWSLSPE